MKALTVTPSDRGIHCMSAPAAGPRGPLSAAAKAAWLVLRDEGGFWTATELGLRLNPAADPLTAGQASVRWLNTLSARGHVVIRRLARINSYGVTARCFPIPGHDLEPRNTSAPGANT